MSERLTGISSMATRLVLQHMTEDYARRHGVEVVIEAVGGIDAAKRVQTGEAFDLVFLSSEAIDKLMDGQCVVAGSKVDIVRSGIAVAVRASAPHPAIDSEEALKRAVLSARTVGYSTGPSGVALQKLFEHWGIAEELKDRIVQAKPGIPVGSMVASGDVELGFQQLSELLAVNGIDIVGPLPPAVQITTTFCGGVCSVSQHAGAAHELLAFMASAATEEAKKKQGMEPA